jgi:hypothetical protein
MTSTHLRVTPWIDPVVDGRGYAIYSSYVEVFWLPVLGPSATVLLQRLACKSASNRRA